MNKHDVKPCSENATQTRDHTSHNASGDNQSSVLQLGFVSLFDHAQNQQNAVHDSSCDNCHCHCDYRCY